MRDIYEKLVEEDGASSQDEFGMDVAIELHVDGLGDGEAVSEPGKVFLKYNIEVEERSWGIKDINVFSKGKVEFEVEVVDIDDNLIDTIDVSIDMSDVGIYWVQGHSYVPESLMVRVDRSGKLLEAELNFYFQSQ